MRPPPRERRVPVLARRRPRPRPGLPPVRRVLRPQPLLQAGEEEADEAVGGLGGGRRIDAEEDVAGQKAEEKPIEM